MQIDIITYLSGISNAIYTAVCLLCGLQLCFGIFSQGRQVNTYLSRILGSCLLVMFVSAVCYLLSDILPDADFLYRIGTSIDIFVFIGYAMMGYALYTNNEPTQWKLIALASPFALCAILNVCFPNWLNALLFVAAAILFAYFIWFGVTLQRREGLLKDIYSNPEAHSLRWIWTTIGLFVGWWIVSGLFLLVPSLMPWYNAAVFAYMTVLFLFVFTKVSNYKEPVSLATQQEMERPTPTHPQREGDNDNENDNENHNENENQFTNSPTPQLTGGLTEIRLRELMHEEQLYLNPDLTIENVATRLATTPQYLSAILNKDMHISFAQFVNGYRVERAKELLCTTDNKVEYIGTICGFNSVQVFNRTFSKLVGETPSDYRKQ